MKPVIQLVAVSLLTLATVGITALTGCAAPTPTTLEGDGTEDPNSADSAQTGKLPPKKPTSTSTNTPKPAPTTAPTTDPTPATPPATTPPVTPAPGTDPMVCMDPCVATGPAATYWTCSANCQDQACDDKCFNASCGANAQACDSALDTCATQCGVH